MTGIIFLFVVILAFWLITRNAKKNKSSEEDSYNAREEGNKAIKSYIFLTPLLFKNLIAPALLSPTGV